MQAKDTFQRQLVLYTYAQYAQVAASAALTEGIQPEVSKAAVTAEANIFLRHDRCKVVERFG